MISNPVETSIGIAMILSAFPVYFVFIHPAKHSSRLGRFSSFISLLTQKLFIAVPEVKEDWNKYFIYERLLGEENLKGMVSFLQPGAFLNLSSIAPFLVIYFKDTLHTAPN